MPCVPGRDRSNLPEASGRAGPAEGRSQVNLPAPLPTESVPDLRVEAPIPPTPSPLALDDRESGDIETVLIPTDSSNPISSHDTDLDTNSDRIVSIPGRDESTLPKPSGQTTDAEATPERKSDWKSTAYAATKLAINLVKESSDVFPPLKSVAGGLSAVLDHCEVRFVPSKLHYQRYLWPS